MLSYLSELLSGIWQSIMALFGFGSSQAAVSNELEVYVRTNTGEKVVSNRVIYVVYT